MSSEPGSQVVGEAWLFEQIMHGGPAEGATADGESESQQRGAGPSASQPANDDEEDDDDGEQSDEY